MTKSKKTQAPKIDPRVMTRPRLDALFERQAQGELDLDGLEVGVRALMTEVGQPAVLEALVKRMEGTPEGERETLMTLLPRLKSREVIDYLWQQVKKRGRLSLDAKMTALVILKEMGEEVDLRDPGLYFSPRDIKPGDIKAAEGMFRTGMRGLARSLRESRDPAEVEAFMHRINKMPEEAIDGTGILMEYIKSGEEGATDLEADFLYALAHTTPFPDVQQKAERALERLAARGVKPVTRAILDLGQDRFYAAYTTDPNHPWQQGVTVAWERAGGVIQALVFLLDFGVPWRGALKDAFATHGMTPQEFQRQLVDKAERRMDMHLYRISLARAQAIIASAVEANRRYKIAFSKDYNEARHLIERWVLHPPAAILEADSTRDELGDLPLTPDRSGKPLMLDWRDLERSETARHWLAQQAAEASNEEWDEESELSDAEIEWDEEGLEPDDEDEFYSFEDVVADVQDVHEVQSPTWWKRDWVSDYLASQSPDPDFLERFDEDFEYIVSEWWTLRDWFRYLDTGNEIHSVTDLRGFHLSEYLQAGANQDDDQGRSRVETVRDWFAHLAQHGSIPSPLPLLSDLANLLAQPDRMTLPVRPEPQGGEIAFWFRAFGADEQDEPFTYNEWWMALVLESKFKGNRAKCRRATQGKPDTAAKLALLDQLERRLAQDSEYLDELDYERPPEPEDYARAERWFDQEWVNDTRAW
jgi:hypothetical protein